MRFTGDEGADGRGHDSDYEGGSVGIYGSKGLATEDGAVVESGWVHGRNDEDEDVKEGKREEIRAKGHVLYCVRMLRVE